MKKETVDNKLNALLGIKTEVVEEIKVRYSGKVVGISEEEIQTFREAQGILYFLQAPALFTAKVCPHCKETFLVSRKYVSYCSYTCIRKSLNEQGIEWKKGDDLEALAGDPQVYNGNEPIWISNRVLERLKETLETLSTNSDENEPEPQSSPSPSTESPQESSGSTTSPLPTQPSSSSTPTQTTTETSSLKITTNKSGKKVRRTFVSAPPKSDGS